MKVLSLGYDLGDGETIIDAAVFEVVENAISRKFEEELLKAGLRMPESENEGYALPTGFGYNEKGEIIFVPSILVSDPEDVKDIHAYFKRQPTNVLGIVSGTQRYLEIISLFKDEKWPKNDTSCKELHSKDFTSFKKSVQTFTDSIFSNKQFKDSVKFNLNKSNCDEIIFCVGHPTKWNELDCLIYKAILNETILGEGEYLGKKSKLILAAESRAAYLYMRKKNATTNLGRNDCSLLIDVGSSTIDVTAVTNDSRNSQYNNGNNYLGVRSIDYLIKEWYVKQLKIGGVESVYQNILDSNPSVKMAPILACRKAKEEAYSKGVGKSKINFAAPPLSPVKLSSTIIDNLAEREPIGSVLKNIVGISYAKNDKINNQTWTELFRTFLEEQKAEIGRQQLKIGRVIMTGSATKMTFVPEIIKQVFSDIPEDDVWQDTNPSRTISQGLALVGPSDAKSKHFQERMKKLNSEDIPRIIERDLSPLADGLAPVVESIVTDIILADVSLWRSDHIRTIDNMIARIQSDLSADSLADKLKSSDRYKTVVKNWTVDTLGKDIALQLKAICEEYNVHEFGLESLNVMTNVSINPGTGTIEVDPLGGAVDFVGGIVAVIGGIITFIIFPSVLAAIVLIIGSISSTLAALIFSVLALIPGPGWVVIGLVVAVSVATIIFDGVDSFKQEFNEKVRSYDLPIWVRERVTDDDIKKKISASDIKGKIKSALLEDKNKNKIVESVSNGIMEQVKQRTDAIKFFIESR